MIDTVSMHIILPSLLSHSHSHSHVVGNMCTLCFCAFYSLVLDILGCANLLPVTYFLLFVRDRKSHLWRQKSLSVKSR